MKGSDIVASKFTVGGGSGTEAVVIGVLVVLDSSEKEHVICNYKSIYTYAQESDKSDILEQQDICYY